MDENASQRFLETETAKLRDASDALQIAKIESNGWDVLVTITRRRDQKPFTIRLRCDGGYPLIAPSVQFVDSADRSREGDQYWPDDGQQAFKRNPAFVCFKGNREYYQRHNEPVNPKDTGLLKIVAEIVARINK
jgi:hypothetical protein